MKAVYQYQNSGSELLHQPRHVIWLEVANPEEEAGVTELCKRIDGKDEIRAGITGIHSLEPEKNHGFPKFYIIGVSV